MNADMVAILDFCIDLDTHSRLITAQIVPFFMALEGRCSGEQKKKIQKKIEYEKSH
jgi:hypothetical protein